MQISSKTLSNGTIVITYEKQFFYDWLSLSHPNIELTPQNDFEIHSKFIKIAYPTNNLHPYKLSDVDKHFKVFCTISEIDPALLQFLQSLGIVPS